MGPNTRLASDVEANHVANLQSLPKFHLNVPIPMKAIVVTDRAAGTAGMKLVERPEPQGAALASLSGANYGDVIVQVHASGFTAGVAFDLDRSPRP